MPYINEHKVLRSEEVMVGNVSANVGLGTCLHGLPDQGRTGATTHGYLSNRDIDGTGTTGH